MTTNLNTLNQIVLDDLLEDCGSITSSAIVSAGIGSTLNWPSINSNSIGGFSTIGNLGALTGLSNPNGLNTSLQVKGLANFEDDVKISGNLIMDGVNVGESLKRIEERIGILRPNGRLEGEWEELRALGDRYRELEAKILDGEKILHILGNPKVDE